MSALSGRRFAVEYTPGPPAIGTLTRTEVDAEDASAAADAVKAQHRWCMIHRVEEVGRAK
jgi:hypothetical protein